MKKRAVESPWRADLKITYNTGCESVSRFSLELEPRWFSIVMVSKGVLEFSVSGVRIAIGPSEICAFRDPAVLSACTGRLRYSIVSCTFTLLLESRIAKFPLGYFDAILARPSAVMQLSRVDLRQLLRLVAMLREKVYRPLQQQFESEIISLCLGLLFYEYGAICGRNAADGAPLHSRPEKIAASFACLIDEHVREQHGVKFYADRLYISPAYLRKCIHVATGMPARYFIDTGLLSQAYVLLSDESLSVYDVSDLLHFSTCSAFRAFFRKYAGLTPSKYRSNLR